MSRAAIWRILFPTLAIFWLAVLMPAHQAVGGTFAIFQVNGSPAVPPPPISSGVLKIGGGGFLSSNWFANDGVQVARTDTFGAYVNTPANRTWVQCVTATSMPSSAVAVDQSDGAYEVMLAPSDSTRVYLYFEGNFYVSSNRCGTFNSTAFVAIAASGNASSKNNGPYIAVDPANKDVAFWGTPSNGMFQTTNAGASVSAVSGVAAGTGSNGNIVDFDPSSAVVGGKTQGIYAASYGTGVYHSTNGGATWALTTGTPTLPQHMAIGSDGTLYLVAADGTQNIHIYNGTSWSSVSTGTNGNTLVAPAVNPANASNVVVVNAAGEISASANKGVTWTDFSATGTFTDTQIPWLAWAQNAASTFTAAGNIQFDPSQSNVLVQSAGIGAWTAPAPTTLTTVNWVGQTLGVEQLVENKIVSIPGGSVEPVNWDRPQLYLGTTLGYPLTYNPNDSNAIVIGYDEDFNATSPGHVVLLATQAPFGSPAISESSYSIDGGRTFLNFATNPPPEAADNNGGGIAIDTADDVVIFPCGGSPVRSAGLTGATWTNITGFTSGWCDAAYLNRHIVTADKVTATTFYAYKEDAGVYKSSDGGATWSLVHSGQLGGNGQFNAQMESSPYVAGELFYTAGAASAPHPSTQAFYHSTDAGATWTTIANVEEVRAFGYGVKASGKSNASLWIAGWVNQGSGYTYGIWESDDDGSTWTLETIWPNNNFDNVKAVAPSRGSYGQAYIGFEGSGAAQVVAANAVLNPIVANESAVSAVAGQAVVTWNSSVSGTCSVNYGTTSAYGSTQTGAPSTNCSVTLTGLSNFTTYHYQVVSGATSSFDFTFTTGNGLNNIALDGSATAHFTSGTSVTATLTTTQSDDEIVVFTNGDPNDTTTGISGCGLTWTARPGSPYGGFDNYYVHEWAARAASPLSACTITVAYGSAVAFVSILATGWSGVATSPFEQNPTAAESDPLSVTTVNPFTEVLGYFYTNTQTPTAGAGFTQFTIGGGSVYAVGEYKALSSSQALSVGMTTGAGTAHVSVADVLVSK